jgi:hypothetical protein
MPNARLIQGLTPEARDLAKRAKTPGPGVMANRKIINKNVTAFSSDMENIPSKIYHDLFLYAETCLITSDLFTTKLNWQFVFCLCPGSILNVSSAASVKIANQSINRVR